MVFRNAVYVLYRRPSMIVLIGLAVFIYNLLDSYNPIIPIISGLSSIGGSDVFQSIISFLQFLWEPGMILTTALIFIGTSIIASIFAGIIFSGYFYILNNTLDGKPKFKGEFIYGLKKYFARISLISVRAFIIDMLFILFMMVASVPAMVITRALNLNKPELIAAAVLIDVLTVGVLLLGMMFLRIYTFFWYPAAISSFKRPFAAGKYVANRNFWRIAGIFLIFDIILIIFQMIFPLIGSPVILFILKWLFGAAFLSLFSAYVFSAFKIYSAAKEL